MKALVYREYGSPDVLEVQEVERPAPKDDEVLVEVHAASVNSWDWDLLSGSQLFNRAEAPFKPKYRILGCDIAGRVEAVGKDAQRLHVGDEVFGDISRSGWGGFAEYVCAHEDVLAPKSPAMTFEQAAAAPQAAVLALQGLHYRGPIEPGQRVLLNGAGGGVGTFALQMAKSFGADVTCVDSASKLDVLRSLGADTLVDYTQEDVTRNEQRYELILDVVGHRAIFDFKRSLSPNGAYVMIGGSLARLAQLLLLGAWTSITSRKKLGILLHRPNREDLISINELFEAGKVAPVVDRCCPLHEVPDALRDLGAGRVTGKVVVIV